MATALDYTGTVYTGDPGICVDSSGDVWISLIGSYSSQEALYIFKNGIQQGTPQTGTVIHGSSWLYRQTMVIDSSDVLHFICLPDNGGADRDLAYNTYTDGSGWGTWIELVSFKTAYTHQHINACIDVNDDIYCVYGYTDMSGQAFMVTNETGSWVEHELGDVPMSYVYRGEAIGIDGTGDVHCFYRDFHGGTPNYMAKKIYDVSASTMGSESEVTVDQGTYSLPDAVWDGSNMTQYIHPYAAVTSEDDMQSRVGTGSIADVGNSFPSHDKHYFGISNSGCDACVAYINSETHLIIGNYGFEGIKHYKIEAGTWTFQSTLRDVELAGSETHNVRIADKLHDYSENYGQDLYYTYRHWDDTASVWKTYYDIIYPGTLVKSSVNVWTSGGGLPSDNQSAWLMGDPPRGVQPAFLYGHYDVGGETRSAEHAFMDSRNSHVSCFLRGQQNMYYDVVEFDANGSTGTQDIISANLGGLAPQLVFFAGAGGTVYDTYADDLRYFYGLTDGTHMMWAGGERATGSGSSSAPNGSVSTARCAGFSYASGGSAAWDSWYQSGANSGVTLDWTVAAGSSWKCAAFMIACDTPNAFSFEQGTFAPDNANTDDEIEVSGVGFQPDFIIFFTPQGGCGSGVGIAQRERSGLDFKQACHNQDLNSGFFNWPGYADRLDTADPPMVIRDGITSVSGGGTPAWGVKSFDADGFTMICEVGDGVYDGPDVIWFAIKIEVATVRMEFDQTALYNGTGAYKWDTNIRPEGLVVFKGAGSTQAYPTTYHKNGASFAVPRDSVTQYSAMAEMLSQGGTEWDTGSVVDDESIWSGGAFSHYVTGFDSDGVAMYAPSAGSVICLNLYFGSGIDAVPSRVKCYMYGHSRFQDAYAHGKDEGESSVSAFFHVVDGQSYKPCYMQGLNPARTSTSAYLGGYDDPCILFHEFQLSDAAGNQDITTPLLNGVTPKAAIVWLYGMESFTDDNVGEALFSLGISDGTNTYAFGMRSWNDLYPYFDQTRSQVIGEIICIDSGMEASPHIDAKATVTFITDGMRLNFNNAPGGTYVGVVQFFAGSEVSVDCGLIDTPGSPGDVAVTAPGFEPDMVFSMEAGYQPFSVDDSDDMWYDRCAWAWSFNDERSPRPTTFGQSVRSYRGASSQNGWQPGGWSQSGPAQDTGYTYPDNLLFDSANKTTFKSFDANGFTINWQGVTFSAHDIVWLAVKWGTSRKANVFVQWADMEVDVDYPLVQNPEGDWNIVPESAIIFNGAWSEPDDFYGFIHAVRPGIQPTYIGGDTNRYFSTDTGPIWWDAYSQYFDQLARSRAAPANNAFQWALSVWEDREWKDVIWANIRFATRNGVIYRYDTIDWDAIATLPVSVGQGPPVGYLVVVWGLAEYTSSTSVYTKGQKVDWPGRTPRGCFLEGSPAVAISSISAFIQVGPAGSIPCYINGFVEGKSTNAAYLKGQDNALTAQSAYIMANAFVLSNNDAYTKGQNDGSDAQESFIWGKQLDVDTVPAFTVGGLVASSSISAWCRSGTDTEDGTPAFLEGIASRSSIPAYTNGFSSTPTSNTPAFINGSGPWPFTDDYTGADEDPWNANKWISTEEI
jgi:hypothetical protein